MMPGPDQVIECPTCGGLARVLTLRSGNTIGARVWTDGKMIAPMLPQSPRITRCRHCGHYYWVPEARVIGEFTPWGREAQEAPEEWKAAGQVRELSESECLEALSAGAADTKEKELWLRTLAWWAGNDAQRAGRPDPGGHVAEARTRSAEATANLLHLLDLLDVDDPDGRLTKAEALRELGRFDEAVHLLEHDFPEEYGAAAALIRRLAEEGDIAVAEFAS